VRALAQESAAAAASVLSQLAGQPVRAAAARVCRRADSVGAAKLDTGIVFEADGAVRGVVALLLSNAGRAAVLEALGVESLAAGSLADSALREVGNMVASHSVSAAADRLGGRVTLSVPTLVREDAGRLIERLLAHREPLIVTTTELRGVSEAPDAVLVFAVQVL
jgi:chemotaxis protein CheY-P-specific phosphatase CheC